MSDFNQFVAPAPKHNGIPTGFYKLNGKMPWVEQRDRRVAELQARQERGEQITAETAMATYGVTKQTALKYVRLLVQVQP